MLKAYPRERCHRRSSISHDLRWIAVPGHAWTVAHPSTVGIDPTAILVAQIGWLRV